MFTKITRRIREFWWRREIKWMLEDHFGMPSLAALEEYFARPHGAPVERGAIVRVLARRNPALLIQELKDEARADRVLHALGMG